MVMGGDWLASAVRAIELGCLDNFQDCGIMVLVVQLYSFLTGGAWCARTTHGARNKHDRHFERSEESSCFLSRVQSSKRNHRL